jgi:hypothetical protein
MTNNRRNFLKLAGLAGIGLMGTGRLKASANGSPAAGSASPDPVKRAAGKRYRQIFNMSGYAAPKLERVRVGFIGLRRGMAHLKSALKLEGVEVKAICDLMPENIGRAEQMCAKAGCHPEIYTGSESAWEKLCEREDIDLVYISTPWEWHVPMALHAMNRGKHVGVEVPAATTVEGCWELVRTSEETRKHCVILENCCYDFFELLTLNMARQGFFGEIIHGEGAYIHDLLENTTKKNFKWNMWRLEENSRHNGNLYPTHGLGPVAQIMNINRGDRAKYLVSMSSNDFMLGPRVEQLAAGDEFYRPYAGRSFRGNMNSTIIRTHKGRTIVLQHDVTSPRPYSRIHLVSGTKGVAQKYPLPGRIAVSHEGWLSETEMQELEEKYQPEIIRRIGTLAKSVGGHGGMDFLMNWRLIDCLRNGLPVDMDVYDAATWSVIVPLSEWSVANRSGSVDLPDFTCGSWKTNAPVSLDMREGGTTRVL